MYRTVFQNSGMNTGLRQLATEYVRGVRMLTTTDVLSVADILEGEGETTIQEWVRLVEKESDIVRIKLNFQDRTGHLPVLLQEVIARLRLDKGTSAPASAAAKHHGELRYKQGYSVGMLIDESRALQVSIFSTLHKNTANVDFARLLPDVVIVADEVDAQLKVQVNAFSAKSN